MALRDVIEEDLEIFFEHQRDPEANHVAAFPARDRDAFFTHWRTKVLDNSSNTKKTIVVGNEVVGNIVSWDQDDKRLVGFWLGRAYWGRGIATTALAEFIAAHEKRRPLCAYVAVQNIGSIRALEKCGFQRIGEAVTGHDGVAEFLMQRVTI